VVCAGSSSSSSVARVEASGVAAPQLIEPMRDQHLNDGAMAHFWCKIYSATPTTCEWYHNNRTLTSSGLSLSHCPHFCRLAVDFPAPIAGHFLFRSSPARQSLLTFAVVLAVSAGDVERVQTFQTTKTKTKLLKPRPTRNF